MLKALWVEYSVAEYYLFEANPLTSAWSETFKVSQEICSPRSTGEPSILSS